MLGRLLLIAGPLLTSVTPGAGNANLRCLGTSQTSPVDWNNANNFVEGLGGGGSGGVASGSTSDATGGGGGEYRKIANFSVATPGAGALPGLASLHTWGHRGAQAEEGGS